MIFRFINPLDLEEILVYKLAGTPTIFILLAFLFIGILAARFKMPQVVLLMVLLSFVSIFSLTYLAGSGFFTVVFILIIIGLAISIGRSLAGMFNR